MARHFSDLDFTTILESLDTPLVVRSFYILATTIVFTLTLTPPLKRLVGYGKTSTPLSSSSSSSSFFPPLVIDFLQALTVPHAYFTHYYICGILAHCVSLYLLLSGRWGVYARPGARVPTMGVEQTLLVWTCFAAQLVRRLYECLFVMRKGNNSRMLVIHYFLGLGYYTGCALAMVCEADADAMRDLGATEVWEMRGTPPGWKTWVSLPVFVLASGAQWDAHVFLAGLKKYSLPKGHLLFEKLVAPHYTAECLVYAALCVMAAPEGRVVNWTITSALVFVLATLASTANLQRAWYEEKFGKGVMDGKWTLVPGVY